MTDAFTTIWEPFTPLEVTLIHTALTPSGIRYFILNEHASQWEGGGLGIGSARMELRVETAKSEQALRLVEAALGKTKGQGS